MNWAFTRDDIPWRGGQAAYDLWRSKSSGGKLPARREFHPKELMATLPTVMLVDVADNKDGMTVRLVGTVITEMMGRDPTGMKVADLRGGDMLAARFMAAAEKAKPYLAVDVPTPFKSPDIPAYSVLVLPLADDGESVNMLMMSLSFD